MKWWQTECKPGDLIRVRCNAIYHYGIFVSESEVIQFGHPPDENFLSRNNDEIEVCVSDIDTFCGGKAVEVAAMERSDKRRRFSPRKTVRLARSRIGEKGYHIIHNNCEHFARECYCGERRCEATERILSGWNGRSICDVYIMEDVESKLESKPCDKLYPKKRERELCRIGDKTLKAEKYGAWLVLRYALMRTFGHRMEDIRFKRSRYGKWSCDKCFFSISHSGGTVAVVVSNSEVGIDLEEKDGFIKRFSQSGVFDSAKEKILSAGDRVPLDASELLSLWTKKESAYKFDGKGAYAPCNISLENRELSECSLRLSGKEYVLSICGHKSKDTGIYIFDGKTAERYKDTI